MSIAQTSFTKYYAVIFTSLVSREDEGYDNMVKKMRTLAEKQPGYLGVESANKDIEITISYWESLEAIDSWKNNVDHQMAMQLGKDKWYDAYKIRVTEVLRDYGFER